MSAIVFAFFSLSTRVDQMESSIIPLGHKIDYMLARLDSVFKERKLKKNDMEKIFEGIVSNDEGLIKWFQKKNSHFVKKNFPKN